MAHRRLLYIRARLINAGAKLSGYAETFCNASGTWLTLPRPRGEWTDYTTCGRVGALLTQEYVHIAFYAASVLALAPALIIFFVYKYVHIIH